MAEYFLEKCVTYRNEIEEGLFRRREVICMHLNENYKAGRNRDEEVFQNVTKALAEEGKTISRSEYQTDKALIRSAFVYLIAATDEERQDLFERSIGSARAGINYLRRDGIKTWAQLMGTAPPQIDDTAEEVEQPVKLRLVDLRGGPEVIQAVAVLMDSLELMLNEDDLLRQENERLNQELFETVARSADSEGYVPLLEAENHSLEEQLQAAKSVARKAHSNSLAELASTYPNVPELMVAAQKIHQAPSRREDALRDLLVRLPKQFVWANDSGKMEYEKHFLSSLVGLPAEEQDQVIEQVSVLAANGSDYSSLHSRKMELRIPFSPMGCMASRATQSIRFTWKKNGSVTLFWLFRKGDSRVRVSEH